MPDNDESVNWSILATKFMWRIFKCISRTNCISKWMLRIFIDFILKTALEWRVNLTVLRSKFKRIRPVWFLSCSDEVSIIAIMKPEECCRPQSRFFVHSPSCCQRIDRKLCSDLRFLSEVSRSAGWRALIWVYICVFFVKYLCSREIPRCKKKK